MNYFAVIEIGSNAIRMILGEKRSNSTLKVVQSWSSHLRLGQEVFQSGHISETFQKHLCCILGQFLLNLDSIPSCTLKIFGTSAIRDAINQEQVLEKIQKDCGVSVQVLSGEEEASFFLEGVKTFLSDSFPRQMVADLGGGSLELSFLKKNYVWRQCSLNVGTLRLRDIRPNLLESHELFQKTILQLKGEAELFLENSESECDLMLSGGNAKTLGRLYLQMHDSTLDSSSEGVSMTWKDFENLMDHFANLSKEMLQESWDLRIHQSEVFHSALKLYSMFGMVFRVRQVRIPFFGLKEALLLKTVSIHNVLGRNDPHWQLLLPENHQPTEVSVF